MKRAFGEKSGWERVSYYRSNASLGDPEKQPRGWAGQLWSPAIEAEHRATRESVGLFDESSFAKIEVSGPDAARLAQFVLSPAGQAILVRHGFTAATQPKDSR